VVWFRLTVGRRNNADPKWLVPLICRLGHVTKKDIGEIRIFERETKFGITRAAEPKFSVAIQAAAEDDVRIEPAGAPPGPREPRRPEGDAPRKTSPWRPEGGAAPPKGPRKPRFQGPSAPPGKKPKPKRRSNDGPKTGGRF
jgi:ATP-dependent RNA helicase DeaD